MSALLAGLGSALGGLLGKAFGGGSAPTGDLVALTAENAGIRSAMQGSNAPPPGSMAPAQEMVPTSISGVIDDTLNNIGKTLPETLSRQLTSQLTRAMSPSASKQGRDNRAYLQSSFPELNPWELSGASATQLGTSMTGQQNEQTTAGRALSTQKDIASQNNQTTERVAGLNAVTSRMNTADQVAAQNQHAAIAQSKLQHEIAAIMARTDLDKQQKQNAIALEHKTYADTLNVVGETALQAVRGRMMYHQGSDAKGSASNRPLQGDNIKADTIYTHDKNERAWEDQDLDFWRSMRDIPNDGIESVTLPGRKPFKNRRSR